MESEVTDSQEDRPSDPGLDLLRSALAEPPQLKKSVLSAVQHRIFEQTRGRYYKQRQSLLKDPTLMLLAGAVLILILTAAGYLVLVPLMNAGPSSVERPSLEDSKEEPSGESSAPLEQSVPAELQD